MKKVSSDVIVIGGGLFGCLIALFLKKSFKKVTLLEKSDELILRASYNNQARVHNGYHYPRSYLTALRSHANYALFLKDFKVAIADEIEMHYAIGADLTKTTARQFIKFCELIGCPLQPARPEIVRLFDSRLVTGVWRVDEAIFDAAILRKILKQRLAQAGVKVLYESPVLKVAPDKKGVIVSLQSGRQFLADQVFNCTYSQINRIVRASGLPALPFKYELTEMPLFVAPAELTKIGITIIDGPFFGTLPFPGRKLHSLYHVRYTVHANWADDSKTDRWPDLAKLTGDSNFLFMQKDAVRYLPILKDIKREESLWEVRTVLQQYEVNDGRPILYKKDYGIPGFHIIMGGKLDNVYDIIEEIKKSQL